LGWPISTSLGSLPAADRNGLLLGSNYVDRLLRTSWERSVGPKVVEMLAKYWKFFGRQFSFFYLVAQALRYVGTCSTCTCIMWKSFAFEPHTCTSTSVSKSKHNHKHKQVGALA
jgi:hypothetical protein